jgi:Ni,Fe-hydrogenase I large subunit
MASVTREVDPISRIEGHLGVKLTVDDVTNKVTEADVHGNLWRGFENFLVGRVVNDAITFTQRICGVCPVPHGQTATYAADDVLGYNDSFQTWVAGGQQLSSATGNTTVPVPAGQGIPAKALHIRNLVLSAEFLMSHITHSYHLAAPSYIQGPNIPPWTPYFADTFYHPLLRATGKGVNAVTDGNASQPDQPGATLPVEVEGFSKDLWSAVIKQYVKALRIRRLTFEAGALFAGRMPMTSCYVAGGVTTDKSEVLTPKCTMYRSMMQEIGNFIIQEFLPLFLALGALYPEYDNVNNDGASPFGSCLGYGSGCGNYLAWGAFPQAGGTLGLDRGYKIGVGGTTLPITKAAVYANLREHIKFSRYAGSVTALDGAGAPVVVASDITDPATEMRTIPKRDDASKYSWLKAPRWTHGGTAHPMEVGPMARLFVAGVIEDDEFLRVTVPGYTAYAKTVGADTGLNPALVSADLGVACVRDGIATLKFNADLTALGLVGAARDWTVTNSGTTEYATGNINIADITQSTIALAYGLPSAVILGPVAGWVYGLKGGASTMDRLRSRPLESFVLIQKMIGGFTPGANGLDPIAWTGGGWLEDLDALGTADTYIKKADPTAPSTSGFGASEAPRGALMHMATIDAAGKITAYQCIVPTTWNASPKDASSVRGPIEEAMAGNGGIPYVSTRTVAKGGAGAFISGDAGGGVEALRVAQSFDPCIACAIH